MHATHGVDGLESSSKVPPAHAWHEVSAVVEYRPTPHDAHGVAGLESVSAVPLVHVAHAVAEAVENVPVSHASQAVAGSESRCRTQNTALPFRL